MNTTSIDPAGEAARHAATKAKQAEAVTRAKKATALELRALVHAELNDIESLLPQVRDLVDTRNPIGGLVTLESEQARADLIRTEKRDRLRITTHPDPVRRQWMSTTATGSGTTRIPGSVAVYSADADAVFTLKSIARGLHKRLEELGVCYLHPGRLRHIADADTEPSIDQVSTSDTIRVVKDLVNITVSAKMLRQIHRDLVAIATNLRTVVDGPDQVTPPDPMCPLCLNPTLVSHLWANPQTITCAENQTTGRFEPCFCRDSFCACRHNPATRHSWSNLPLRTTRRLRQIDRRWTWDELKATQKRHHEAVRTPARRPPVNTHPAPGNHALQITFDGTEGFKTSIVCTAAAGATCRQAYACHLAGNCDPKAAHDDLCTPQVVDVEYCTVSEWLDYADVLWCGHGEITVPITETWNVDQFEWSTTGAPAETTAAVEQ